MNLFNEIGNKVIKTSLSRKITLNGITKAYPVYKIHIDLLYYNDQNDRIATWISQYKNENGIDALQNLDREEYNKVIENFIYESNPSSIEKTKLNIELVGQRESGVVLKDGRVIDGNRRFTCIRKINETTKENCWFESIILDIDINSDKKAIKILELNIQHGEEKRVDYNHIERLIGVYQDIVETQLLTINEYSISTNESIGEVKKRVEASKIIVEFLEFIKMPKQFHVVREYQIVSLVNDLQDLFKKCNSIEEINAVKKVTFANFLMNVFTDGRKYIKNLATMISNHTFFTYVTEINELIDMVEERLQNQKPNSYRTLKTFVHTNRDLTFEMTDVLDRFVNGAKRIETRNKPSQVVSKTINSLKDIDLNIIEKLTPIEKEQVNSQVTRLSLMIDQIKSISSGDKPVTPNKVISKKIVNDVVSYNIISLNIKDEILVNFDSLIIDSLLIDVNVKRLYSESEDIYELFFIDTKGEKCSNVVESKLYTEITKYNFELATRASSESELTFCIRNKNNDEKSLVKMIKVDVKIEFKADFGF